ncbi:hypothetical protein ABEG18_21985 [Alsobacter sp. KACC 23698]|uniref:AAA family ATPase n=1 Tax=Alsobacter sp. KACC 23698 TaxID=3149229 RepID=A0AAU7JDR7_9HYPH
MVITTGGPTRPQYADVVQALTPVLHNLPPKLVALDGWPDVGKTTLGRFLAWRFNVTLLETDLFLTPRPDDRLVYLNNQITRIIDDRLQGCFPRPIIVEGIAVLRLLKKVQRAPDFVIHVTNRLVLDAGNLIDEMEAYDAEFRPRERADLTITLDN